MLTSEPVDILEVIAHGAGYAGDVDAMLDRVLTEPSALVPAICTNCNRVHARMHLACFACGEPDLLTCLDIAYKDLRGKSTMQLHTKDPS